MLNEQAQTFVDRIAGAPSFREMGLEAMRANGARLRRLAGPVEPVARTEDHVLPGGAGVVVRRYSPAETDDGRPTLVFAHGGGWVAGDPDESDTPLSALANRSGWNIVSVRYRLAPEFPYPAAADDVFAALEWASQTAGVLAIAGESAGGALAVGAAQRWSRERDTPLALLVGIYPALGSDVELPSYETFGAFGMKPDDVKWFFEMYLPEGVDRTGAIPLESESFAGLPSTLIVSAENDVLIDEAEIFVARARADGVSIDHHVEPGTVHGFFGLGSIMDASATVVDLLADRLRSIAAPVAPGERGA